MAAVSLEAVPINKILGPVILGVCVNAFFYGFSALQFAQYRARRFKDVWQVQLLVTWTFLIDTAHTVALCWMLWSYIVDNYSNVAYLFSAPWPFVATPTFLVLTSGPIQVYFAHRVWSLSRSRPLYWIIIALSGAGTVMGFVATVFAFTHANVNDFNLILPIIDTWLALSVVCDGVISCCLIYYLARSRSGFRQHETYRNRVAHAFIESSVLTSIFALGDLITYSIIPNTNYHIILGIPMGRVYTCTLLAMLNARLKLQEDMADGIVSCQENHQSYERHGEFANAFHNLKRGTTQVRVGVSEQVDVVALEDTPRKVRVGNCTESEHSAEALDHKAPVIVA